MKYNYSSIIIYTLCIFTLWKGLIFKDLLLELKKFLLELKKTVYKHCQMRP